MYNPIEEGEHYDNCPQHEDNWKCDDPDCKIRPPCKCEDIHLDREADAADQARDAMIDQQMEDGIR